MWIIYIHINIVNGMAYIGQTCRGIERRKGRDWSGYKRCTEFYKDIIEYGGDAFETHILERCETLKEADRREVTLIAAYQTRWPKGYNIRGGGSNGLHTEETKQKQREAHFGKTLSEETKQKIRESLKGKYAGEKNGMYGKKHTKEAKQQMREAKRGKYAGEKNQFYGIRGRKARARSQYTQRQKNKIRRRERYQLMASLLFTCSLCKKHIHRKRVREGFFSKDIPDMENAEQLSLFDDGENDEE